MAREQLSLFGGATTISAEAVELPADSVGIVATAPVPVIDPRQCGLFEGPLADLGALQTACEVSDTIAARAIWGRICLRFPDWAGAQPWPRWLDDLEWLAGGPGTRDIAAGIRRACQLKRTGTESQRLAGMAPTLRARIEDGLLEALSRELVATHGPATRCPDGRPAGYLLLLAGRWDQARAMLAAASRRKPEDGDVHAYLGEALWRLGDRQRAFAAYAQACATSPRAIDDDFATCTPILDLIHRAAELELSDEPTSWVPVLADLEGLLSISLVPDLPTGGGPALEAAIALRSLRRLDRRSSGETERIALKRTLLKLAPPLKEMIRRL